MPSLANQNNWAIFKLAFKHWLRDLYSNEKRLLILATLLAAVSMAMISSFSDRLQRTMNYRASELIAGDVTIFSTRPIPSSYVEKSGELDLNHSEAIGNFRLSYAFGYPFSNVYKFWRAFGLYLLAKGLGFHVADSTIVCYLVFYPKFRSLEICITASIIVQILP